MIAVDVFFAATGLTSTGIAFYALSLADKHIRLSAKRFAIATMWRDTAVILAARLHDEREANFLHTHLHHQRAGADAQETTQPG